MATKPVTIAEALKEVRATLGKMSSVQLAKHVGPLSAEQKALVRNFVDSTELVKEATGVKHPKAKASKHSLATGSKHNQPGVAPPKGQAVKPPAAKADKH